MFGMLMHRLRAYRILRGMNFCEHTILVLVRLPGPVLVNQSMPPTFGDPPDMHSAFLKISQLL